MGSIHIDLQAILLLSDRVKSESSGVRGCEDVVRRVRNEIDSKILARRNIRSRFANVQNTLDRLAQDLSAIGGVMANGANQYRQTDLRLTRSASDVASAQEGLSGAIGAAVGNNSVLSSAGTGKKEQSGFADFINNKWKDSGSVLHGSVNGAGSVLGASAAGVLEGDVLYGEVGVESKASFKFRDENGKRDYKSFGLTTEAKASGCLAKGKASGNIGYLRGEAEGVLLTGTVSGTAKATLWDDGKFTPSLGVGAKAEASAAKGNAEVRVGAEQYGVYGKAEGDALHAEAEAEAGVGYIGKGKDGSAQYGASAKASAMASVAQGSVKGGITLFGVDIDVGVKGYAVAAGVEAGGSISTKGVKAKIGGALAIGGGLEVSVDWSDAEWIGDAADAIGDFLFG